MDNNSITMAVLDAPKKGRGRPPKPKSEAEQKPKRGRGRPRKHPVTTEEVKVKRGRGRPRKYPVLEKEGTLGGELRPVLKKVDSGYLTKKLFDYFTKLLVIHHEVSEQDERLAPLFKRLKALDFQMVEVAKAILSREYIDPSIENKVDIV